MITAPVSIEVRMYTVPEVAQLLRVPRGTAYALARAGHIRTVRLGRKRLRVPPGEVARLLDLVVSSAAG